MDREPRRHLCSADDALQAAIPPPRKIPVASRPYQGDRVSTSVIIREGAPADAIPVPPGWGAASQQCLGELLSGWKAPLSRMTPMPLHAGAMG
jgi:hypothetical protein